MRKYEVEVHGAKVKVSVVPGNARLIDEKISELKATLKKRIMGVDVRLSCSSLRMLLLCAEDVCLIIPSFGTYLVDSYPKPEDVAKSVRGKLLSDQTICFVGMNFGSSSIYRYLDHTSVQKLMNMVLKAGAELGHLAAMVLKKPGLESKGLSEIAGEVGIDIRPLSNSTTSLKNKDAIFCGKFFSEDDIKIAIHDVYGSYLVGKKILGMLET